MLAHFVAAALAPLLVRALGRRAFLVLALVPAAACAWAFARTGEMADGGVYTEVRPWVPALHLDLAFAMGSLQWVMASIVAGVGTLVLIYCTWYFDDDEAGLAPFAADFVAFAGAMLGLVLADDLLLLYVFWELTTVFSYLLIGHDPTRRAESCRGNAGADRDHPGRPRHAGRHPGRGNPGGHVADQRAARRPAVWNRHQCGRRA